MKNRFLSLAMVSFALLGLVFAITPSRPGTAARLIRWRLGHCPVNLSNSETLSSDPSMAVDPSGVVHVVWSEETDDGRSFISYAQLSEGNWSPANEITGSRDTEIADYPTLASRRKRLPAPGVARRRDAVSQPGLCPPGWASAELELTCRPGIYPG